MNIKLFCLSTLLMFSLYADKTDRIKMYAIYTPSHEVLVKDWFTKSLQDDFEVVLVEHKQECESAQFMKSGWKKTTMHKVELWEQAVLDNWGKIFICSDVDIQFFAPIETTIRNIMEEKDLDLVIQQNAPNGTVCSGFFACKGNEKVLQLFKAMHKMMKESQDKSDQNSMNYLIRSTNPFDIKWDYLPVEFFATGTLTGHYWQPGSSLKMPQNIVMQHASHTTGIPNKIKLLEYGANVVQKRKVKK